MEDRIQAAGFYQNSESIGLEDVCGQEVWKNLFYGCIPDKEIEEWLGIPRTWCFLLSGESGTGKVYLAKAFAAEMRKYGYLFLQKHAMDLVSESETETRKRINELLNELISGKHCFLLLQDLDSLSENMAAIVLAQGMEKLKDMNLPVVFVATTENKETVPAALQRIFHICTLNLPDENSRCEYFKQCWGNSFLSGAREFGAKQMAEITVGMNYRQLELLRMCVNGVMRNQGLKKCKTVSVFRRAVEEGKVALSKTRFQQITEKVRQGEIVVPATKIMQQETADEINSLRLQPEQLQSQERWSILDDDFPLPSEL